MVPTRLPWSSLPNHDPWNCSGCPVDGATLEEGPRSTSATETGSESVFRKGYEMKKKFLSHELVELIIQLKNKMVPKRA